MWEGLVLVLCHSAAPLGCVRYASRPTDTHWRRECGINATLTQRRYCACCQPPLPGGSVCGGRFLLDPAVRAACRGAAAAAIGAETLGSVQGQRHELQAAGHPAHRTSSSDIDSRDAPVPARRRGSGMRAAAYCGPTSRRGGGRTHAPPAGRRLRAPYLLTHD